MAGAQHHRWRSHLFFQTGYNSDRVSYESSDFAFDKGVQARYLLWGFEEAGGDTYPANPDNLWRIIRYGSINYSKTTAVSPRELVIRMIREGLGPTAHQIFLRRFDTAEDTTDVTSLIGNEMYSSANTFSMFNPFVFGRGFLMPPRAQLAANVSSESSFSCSATIFFLESASIDKLKPYM